MVLFSCIILLLYHTIVYSFRTESPSLPVYLNVGTSGLKPAATFVAPLSRCYMIAED